MAVSQLCGFEMGSLNEVYSISTTGGTPSVQSTTVHSGTYALRTQATSAAQVGVIFSSRAAAGTLRSIYQSMRFYMRFPTLPAVASFGTFMSGCGTGVNGTLSLAMTSTGQLALRSGGVSRATSVSTLSTNTWYRIEFDAGWSSGSGMRVYVDGVQFASDATADTGVTTTTAVSLGWLSPTVTWDVYYDDIVFENAALGSVRTADYSFAMLTPTGDSAAGGWKRPDGTTGTGLSTELVTPLAGNASTVNGTGKRIENIVSSTTDNYDATMQSYTAAGVPAGAVVNSVMAVTNTAQAVTTGSPKAGAVVIVSNPSGQTENTFDYGIPNGTGGSTTANVMATNVAGASATSGWGTNHGPVTSSPTVTLGTAPVARVGKRIASTREVDVDFLGIYADYTVPPTIVVAAAGGGNWNSTATWVGGVIPTSTITARLDATSGNVTLTADADCKSFDCTGYTGTFTMNDACDLTMYEGGLTLSSGMTFAPANLFNCLFRFRATTDNGGAGWPITSAGKQLGSMHFGNHSTAATGKWTLQDAPAANTSSNWWLDYGHLDFGNQTLTIGYFESPRTTGGTRTLTLGSSVITLGFNSSAAWVIDDTTGLTFNVGTSTLIASGSSPPFVGGGLTYNNVSFTGTSTPSITDSNTFANLTRTGTANRVAAFKLGANQTVTGTLTVNGNSVANRMLLQSDTVGTARTITVTGAWTCSYVDFMDITGAGAASRNLAAITGLSGDCGGNSGFTFTTAATQTRVAGVGGSWGTAGNWSPGRIPLPQDDVVVNAGLTGTTSVDMPRLGKNIDFTGFAGTANFATTTATVFGSLTWASGMTITATFGITFGGRGSYTVTSNGKSYPWTVFLDCATGTYTLADALTTADVLSIKSGTLTTSNQAVTVSTFAADTASTATLNLGSSTVTFTSTSGTALWSSGSSLTLSAASAIFVVGGASASSRAWDPGSGYTFGTLTYTVAASTGILQLSGSNTFGTINVSGGARGFRLTAGTTTTVTTFNVFGTAGNLITLDSSAAGSPATLTKAGGGQVQVSYVSLQDSAATPTATWYNSPGGVNVSGNTGWVFGAPPLVRTSADTRALADSLVQDYDPSRALAETRAVVEALVRNDYDVARTPSDTRALADAVGRNYGPVRAIADACALADALTKSYGPQRTPSDTRVLVEALVRSEILIRPFPDTRVLTDTYQFDIQNGPRLVDAADTRTTAEAVARQAVDSRPFSNSAGLAESLVREYDPSRTPSDTRITAESAVRLDTTARTVAEALAPTEAATRGLTGARSLSDAISFVGTLASLYIPGRLVFDTRVTAETVVRFLTLARASTDSLTADDLLVGDYDPRRTPSETVARADAIVSAVTRPRSITETRTLVEVVARTLVSVRSLAEAVDLAQDLVALVVRFRTAADSWSTGLPVVQRLAPDFIRFAVHLAGNVAAVQDDPDDADDTWLTADATPGELRVSFPRPPSAPRTGAGQQEFRIRIRSTG